MLFTIKRKPKGFLKNPLVIVIKKGIKRKASARNLLRRRIKSIIKLAPEEITKNDLLIIVGSEILEYSYQEIKAKLLKNLKKQ